MVTVDDMQDYMAVDADTDKNVIQNLINSAEIEISSMVSASISLETLRDQSLFNTAVRTLVDFWYFNRGNNGSTREYPAGFKEMVNRIYALNSLTESGDSGAN